MPVQKSVSLSALFESEAATNVNSAGFVNSEAWNEKPASFIQRLAPFTSGPTSVTTSRMKHMTSAGSDSFRKIL